MASPTQPVQDKMQIDGPIRENPENDDHEKQSNHEKQDLITPTIAPNSQAKTNANNKRSSSTHHNRQPTMDQFWSMKEKTRAKIPHIIEPIRRMFMICDLPPVPVQREAQPPVCNGQLNLSTLLNIICQNPGKTDAQIKDLLEQHCRMEVTCVQEMLARLRKKHAITIQGTHIWANTPLVNSSPSTVQASA